jgi:hypothetical protein
MTNRSGGGTPRTEKMDPQCWAASIDKPGCAAARLKAELSVAQSALADKERELKSLRAFKRSVDEALNSGDGVYRP